MEEENEEVANEILALEAIFSPNFRVEIEYPPPNAWKVEVGKPSRTVIIQLNPFSEELHDHVMVELTIRFGRKYPSTQPQTLSVKNVKGVSDDHINELQVTTIISFIHGCNGECRKLSVARPAN
jgi:hypothetical protein